MIIMKTEFETKVLEINVEKIILKLESLWAKFIWKKEQKRFTYDFHPIQKNSWVRLRTDGIKTTLTIKEIENDNIVYKCSSRRWLRKIAI